MGNMNSINNWILAVRPKTLPAAIGPVLIGFALAFRENAHHTISVLLALTVAVLIQIGTNLVNDYSDFRKGADTSDRIGPIRVTQAGLITSEEMKIGMAVVLLLIILFSIPLILRGGTPILIIGIISVISGIIYTAGPFPLGYKGLGDIFVLVFFGPVAVGGTYYLQTFELNPTVLLSGLGPGFLSMAILCVNNLRDYNNDKVSKKNTLVVLFGKSFGKYEYLFSIIISSVIPILIFILGEKINYSILVILILIPAIKPLKIILNGGEGVILNEMLGYTGKLLLVYSIVYSIGWQFVF